MAQLQTSTTAQGKGATERHRKLPKPELKFTPELAREMEPLYARVKHVVTPMEWPHYAPAHQGDQRAQECPQRGHPGAQLHDAGDLPLRRRLPRRQPAAGQGGRPHEGRRHRPGRRALHGRDVEAAQPGQDRADPGSARRAARSPPRSRARTSARLREAYPGVPVVTYVNTSADVKAESDICCTSSNAVKVVESLGVPRVLLIPDEFLAKYVADQDRRRDHRLEGPLRGARALHGRGAARPMRKADPGTKIIAHPECPPDVIEAADFTGSTAAMIDWVKDKQPRKVLLVTECSMSSNVAAEVPDVEFVRPCNLCPHMKRISLGGYSRQPARDEARGHCRSRRRGEGAPRGRADGQPDELNVLHTTRGAATSRRPLVKPGTENGSTRHFPAYPANPSDEPMRKWWVSPFSGARA